MAITLKQLERAIEGIAPLRYAYNWDNSGTTLAMHPDVKHVLICLDVTEEVLCEAEEAGADTILSHHPLVFSALKKFSREGTARLFLRAVEMGLNLYAAHTSYDCAPGGINDGLARRLGLRHTEVLRVERTDGCAKVVVFVPEKDRERVAQAMFQAGAGQIGAYSKTAFYAKGTGTFLPGDGTHPAIGAPGQVEFVEEVRLECICPSALAAQIAKAARAAHPYEEPAIDVYALESPQKPVGIGVVGELDVPVSSELLAENTKNALRAACVRTNRAKGQIQRVACVGGAGGDMVEEAVRAGADALVTGEAKHSHFLEAEAYGLLLVEAGHFDTEALFIEDMAAGLQKICDALQYKIVLSKTMTANPIRVL